MIKRLQDWKMDKTAFSTGTFGDENDEPACWCRATIAQRLDGIEFMRQVAYAYDPNTTRLQRHLEIIECPWS